MPSDLIVEACKIAEIKKHPNADKLELAVIKGWETAVPKGKYKAGDVVIYVPPDAVLPQELSNKWGVTPYLSKQRVKAIRLRGEMSFGLIAENEGYKEGVDLKNIAQHILCLTKLNWASVKSFCHEPITTKYAGHIAYFMNVFINDSSFSISERIRNKPWFL